jgi:hypothetical protein
MKLTFRKLVVVAPLAGLVALLSTTEAPALAQASAPTLHEARSVTLSGSVSEVWARLGQFPDLTWVAAVRGSVATRGNEAGSVRSLDFGSGKLTETLVKYSARNHSYTYKINDTDENRRLAPVSNVVATIAVTPVSADASTLTWSFAFRRVDQSATPVAGADDVTARKQIAGTLAMGMAGAAKAFPAAK